MENENKKSAFLEKISNENMKKVLDARISQLEKQEKKEKRKKDLAEITKELLDSEYVDLGDTSLSIGDMLVSTATANMINNPRVTFKEINDAQKVIDNNTNNMNGVTIVVNTNGQDLGDEV
jgi:hypothetical protein